MRPLKMFVIKRITVTIDNTVLEKLEKLSMLKIEDDKKEELAAQLTEILSYIENLNELDTDALDASFSTLSGGTPLREDHPKTNREVSESIFKHAPDTENDFFIVPKIIE